ncbi:MAG TPA: response regulator [Caulobacteraceae bacterium]|jgi:CheY-like chemotaxis protein
MSFRVLVVEDEGLVAMTLEDMLDDLGCEIAGSAASVKEALAWIAGGGAADAALLDISLAGEYVFPVAEALTERGVPFAFTTGYGETPAGQFRTAPLVSKPVRKDRLAETLRLLGRD